MFSQALVHGTARMKEDKETEEEDKQKRVEMGKSKSGPPKNKSQDLDVAWAYHPPGSLLPEANGSRCCLHRQMLQSTQPYSTK